MKTQKRYRRYANTRRGTGRRGLTPIKTRQKRLIPKTHRSNHHHRVDDVSVYQHSGTQHDSKRKGSGSCEHSQHQEWKGDQGSTDNQGRKDEKEQTPIDEEGDKQYSTEQVHPGTLQEVQQLFEQDAFQETADKTEIEAEELK